MQVLLHHMSTSHARTEKPRGLLYVCTLVFVLLKPFSYFFQILTQACEQPDGHEKVAKAMDDYKVYIGENCRFEGLVLSIITKPSNPAYQVKALD